MYSGHSEVVAGLGRSGFAAANYQLVRYVIALLVLATVFLLPYVLIPWSLKPLLALMSLRAVHALYFKHSVIWSTLFHPIQVLYLLTVAACSVFGIMKGTIVWKGRPVIPA
jgi:glucan phosphoethanolaminetransferase (alkaline phosphatase superfamily)